MSPSDFLIEIGTEEIPAGYVPPALESFAEKLPLVLREMRIECGDVTPFGTPRRLALRLADVAEMQADDEREVTGPPSRIAFDGEGNPTKAAIGFAKTNGVKVEELRRVKTEKGEYITATVFEKGRPTGEILSDILPGIVGGLPFPKTMRWDDSGFLFARPVRWIVALHGERVVPVRIGDVESGRKSRGHRVLHPEPVLIESPESYEESLRAAYVIVSPEERQKKIEEQIADIATDEGGRILDDRSLVAQVNYLVEYPHAIRGAFDSRYLSLPERVIITAMRSHQRYFSVVDEQGALLPYFVTIANGDGANEDHVRAGNERVLAARLADAEFYWNEDRSVPLDERVLMLDRVLWQEGMGSLLDKTERIEKLVAGILDETGTADRDTPLRAARLSKADLTTEMIRDGKEFTALQGYMGMEYARVSGEPEQVARTIFEQYLPRFSGDELPGSFSGAVLSLADRVDTMLGCIGLGQMPTGSQDPYALRRHARAVLRILGEGGVAITLPRLLRLGVEAFGDRLQDPEAVYTSTIVFLHDRMKNLLTERGYPYDIVDAVLASGLENPADSERCVEAIRDFRKKESFEKLVFGFKRVVNILKGAGDGNEVDPSLFQEDAEKGLHKAVESMRAGYETALTGHDYSKAMDELIELRSPIDRFFDEVLVMDKDERIRANRVSLLSVVAHLFRKLADLSQVVLEGESR